VHRREGGHYPASIGDVLAQRFFYSRLSSDGSKTLDDMITDYENRLATLLASLRGIPIDGEVEASLAAEVIAHLTPRSASVRRMFRSSLEGLVTATAEAFANEDTFFTMLGLDEPVPNSVWIGHVSHMLDGEPQIKELLAKLPIEKSALDRVLFMAAKEQFVGGFDIETLGIAQGFATILKGLEEMVRDTHNNALAKGPVAEPRKKLLEELSWTVRAAPSAGAILPDCVAIGLDAKGEFIPYMMTTSDAVSVVIMPLSSQKLLVGVRPSHYVADIEAFNRHAAACSDELFIVASKAPVFDELRANMGTRWIGEIDALIQTVLRDVLPNKERPARSRDETWEVLPFSYQLTCNGPWGNADDVAPLNEATHRVVGALRPAFNLDRLDGITFAANYEGAFDELERGFDIKSTPEGTPDHIAQGAATAIVLRDGVPKIRIILNAQYGLSLVGEEPQDAMAALHLLVAGLIQVDTLDRIEKDAPGFLMESVPMSNHDAVLHCALRKALRAYRYARDSAGFGADELIEQEFSKYLLGTMDHAYAFIERAKADHAATPNFPRLFSEVHLAATDILISVARLIGHRHGMGQFEAPSPDTSLGAALRNRQLANWIEVIARDLQRFWQRDTWTKADFYGLNIHLERVLWTSGVVLWPAPNGQETMIWVASPPA